MSDSYLRFWGVRGSYPAPFDSHCKVGGNTSCVEIRIGDEILVCDAGSGIIPLGNELIKQNDVRELTVILTHYHWDHISGLPFFVPAFMPGWKIHFFGPGETEQDIAKHLSDQMKAPYFPVETETWLAEIKYLEAGLNPLDVGPIHIEHFNVHHPGSTFGYRIHAEDTTIVYVSDNELAFINESIERRKPEFDAHEQDLLDGMKEEDRRRVQEFMQDVDVLIHDAQYTPEDYQKKRGWGHSCYIDTVNSAIDAGVKDLYLFHVDPNYNDDLIDAIHKHSLEIIKKAKSNMRCHVAREGMQIDLGG